MSGELIAFYQVGYGVAAFGVGPLRELGGFAYSAAFSAGSFVRSFLLRPLCRSSVIPRTSGQARRAGPTSQFDVLRRAQHFSLLWTFCFATFTDVSANNG